MCLGGGDYEGITYTQVTILGWKRLKPENLFECLFIFMVDV